MKSACKTMALASALVVGGSVQALAVDPPGPQANRVWGGCQLSGTTVSQLKLDLKNNGGIANPEVSFIVVYVLNNDNDGQKVGGDFTGPVICRDATKVGITAFDKNGEAGKGLLKETTDIPTETDPGVPQATSVDIPNFAQGSVLQYFLNNGANAGTTENRVCHTTDANVDCFRICSSSSGRCFP